MGYEERATKAKAEYAACIAKVKGTEAFQAYMDKKAAVRKKKLARSVRSAMHKVPKDAKLKKPLSGYMLWFKGARSTIKGKNMGEVSKKAGEMWKGLSAEKKKPFADKAQEAKKTYDAYVATSKGAAALKSYKDAIAKARAPLTKNSDAAKAKKAAKKEKVQALKEKAKARAAAAKDKVKAMKAAKAEKSKQRPRRQQRQKPRRQKKIRRKPRRQQRQKPRRRRRKRSSRSLPRRLLTLSASLQRCSLAPFLAVQSPWPCSTFVAVFQARAKNHCWFKE